MDYADLTDLADDNWPQPTSARVVRWLCPYCGHEIAAEYSACCGEVHAQPMSEGHDDY